MAQRRMFAKTIIDSDLFLDMPLSTQALYFHLNMRADDEGFVNNHKKIQRMIGASEDDMKMLLAKNFIIAFDTGVIVIKHWKIHNYIRSDRLIKTNYQNERSLLDVEENGEYSISKGLEEISNLTSVEKRKIAYQESDLPYSFEYKVKRAFEKKCCPVCGKVMTSAYKNALPTIQHNIPISKGGKHDLDNISVICESCNVSIKDKETGSLNNADVIKAWDRICLAEKNNIKWFDNPDLLDEIDVSQMSVRCQSDVSIGKDRLGKDSIGKDSIGKDNLSNTNVLDCPTKSDLDKKKFVFEEERELWNSLKSLGIAPIRGISPNSERAKHLKARFNQYGSESFKEIVEAIKQSDFLQGKHNGKRPWQATFDWVILPSNYPKVLEGNYKNSNASKHTGSQFDYIDIGE